MKSSIVFEKSAGIVSKKSNSSQIVEEINIEDNIEAPISKGEILGSVSYFDENELVETVNLIAEKDVPKLTFFNIFKQISYSWITLLKQNS